MFRRSERRASSSDQDGMTLLNSVVLSEVRGATSASAKQSDHTSATTSSSSLRGSSHSAHGPSRPLHGSSRPVQGISRSLHSTGTSRYSPQSSCRSLQSSSRSIYSSSRSVQKPAHSLQSSTHSTQGDKYRKLLLETQQDSYIGLMSSEHSTALDALDAISVQSNQSSFSFATETAPPAGNGGVRPASTSPCQEFELGGALDQGTHRQYRRNSRDYQYPINPSFSRRPQNAMLDGSVESDSYLAPGRHPRRKMYQAEGPSRFPSHDDFDVSECSDLYPARAPPRYGFPKHAQDIQFQPEIHEVQRSKRGAGKEIQFQPDGYMHEVRPSQQEGREYNHVPQRRNLSMPPLPPPPPPEIDMRRPSLPPPPPEIDMRRPSLPNPPSLVSEEQNWIEVAPGVELRFRGAKETWNAVSEDFYIPTQCIGCDENIFCILDASHVICPKCRTVGPLDKASWAPEKLMSGERDETSLENGSVGLGFTFADLAKWQEQIVGEREHDLREQQYQEKLRLCGKAA